MTSRVQSSAIVVFCFEKRRENLLLIFLTYTDSIINYVKDDIDQSSVCEAVLTLNLN